MDDTARTIAATFVTGMIGLGIIGIKAIIEDAAADWGVEHRCYCGCLMQDHYQRLAPGRSLVVITDGCYKHETCLKYREVPTKKK